MENPPTEQNHANHGTAAEHQVALLYTSTRTRYIVANLCTCSFLPGLYTRTRWDHLPTDFTRESDPKTETGVTYKP